MILGEIVHDEHYDDVFPDLLQLVESAFDNVDSGSQGDAWIWIVEGDEKVALDTFTSERFQLKSSENSSALIERVVSILEGKYKVYLYEKPEMEGYEDLI